MTKAPDTPCLICERAIMYLWPDITFDNGQQCTNLNNAVDLDITGGYGSRFDLNIYHAIICDDCLDKAIQRRRVTFVKSYPESV